MKKTVLGILTLAVVLSACATTAFAAGPNGSRNPSECSNDGVCSNPSTSCVYTDTDENGICDVREAKSESGTAKTGKAFTDEDGDGVCDNYTSAQSKDNENGHRNQGECKDNSQREQGKNFVDADSDGVCDRYTSEKCKGDGSGCKAENGCQNGFRGGRNR